MNLQEALDILKGDDAFTGWREDNKDAYLSHVFRMLEQGKDDWQLGYYSAKDDRITTFLVAENKVEIRPDEEIFKEEHTTVKPLDLDKATKSLHDIIEAAKRYQEENHPKDKPMKIIAILQNLQEAGQVWNLTLITQAFNTLNLKLDPATAEVRDSKITSIFSFRQA